MVSADQPCRCSALLTLVRKQLRDSGRGLSPQWQELLGLLSASGSSEPGGFLWSGGLGEGGTPMPAPALGCLSQARLHRSSAHTLCAQASNGDRRGQGAAGCLQVGVGCAGGICGGPLVAWGPPEQRLHPRPQGCLLARGLLQPRLAEVPAQLCTGRDDKEGLFHGPFTEVSRSSS